jgi:FkbM family methyltransferase
VTESVSENSLQRMSAVASPLKKLRRAIMQNPSAKGWIRRAYVGLGLQEKSESDYLFDLARSKKDIFVLQVGANDGKRHDSLSPFMHKYAWRGVLLEPLPDVFADLRRNYAKHGNVSLLKAALADRDGEMTFYRVRPDPEIPDNCQELGSFYREVVEKHAAIFPQMKDRVVTEQIQAISFGTLVSQFEIEKIDAVIIDTEGYDFEILKMIDFQRFRPKLVIYEHLHLNKEDMRAAGQLLEGLGYDVHPIKRGDANTVAVFRNS